MNKTRLYALTKEQLSTFLLQEDGTLLVPDTFEVYIVPSAEDLRKQRICELEAELAQMGEPTQEEPVEAGKMMHPYYMLVDELKRLREE